MGDREKVVTRIRLGWIEVYFPGLDIYEEPGSKSFFVIASNYPSSKLDVQLPSLAYLSLNDTLRYVLDSLLEWGRRVAQISQHQTDPESNK